MIKEFVKAYWMQSLYVITTGLVTWVVSRICKRVVASVMEQNAMKAGILALLHYDLFRFCQELIDKNNITVDEMETLDSLFKSYEAFGGNGTGKQLYTRCTKLPLI